MDIENHAFYAQPCNKSIISKQITYEPLVTVTINIALQTLVTVFLSGVFVGEIHESKNDFCLSLLKIRTVKHETKESKMILSFLSALMWKTYIWNVVIM